MSRNNSKRVLPAGLKQDEKEDRSTALSTPTSSSADEFQEVADKLLKIDLIDKPLPPYRYRDFDIDKKRDEKLALKIKKRKLGKNVSILRKALFPTVSKGIWDLSEASAAELLKLKYHAKLVLDEVDRFDFLITDLQRSGDNNETFSERLRKIRKFDEEIGNELKKSDELKDFLKVLVKFYSNCYGKVILDDCLKAILGAQIFTVEEMPEAFGMSKNEIFLFACKNGSKSTALDFVRSSRDQSLDLYDGAMAAKISGNDDLLDELIALIGEIYGTKGGGIYHSILYEILWDAVNDK